MDTGRVHPPTAQARLSWMATRFPDLITQPAPAAGYNRAPAPPGDTVSPASQGRRAAVRRADPGSWLAVDAAQNGAICGLVGRADPKRPALVIGRIRTAGRVG